jgi:NAD(P)-dependent dehydrogenase (short-subunit alcohol dehydrogenase family)
MCCPAYAFHMADSPGGHHRIISLTGTVAVVTGASRGIGKGIAAALGNGGATVYVTGRTAAVGEHELPGTIGETAAEVTRRGGTGIAVQLDHADDRQVTALFDRIRAEQGRLDILVNNAFMLSDDLTDPKPLWEKPLSNWEMVDVGVRSNFASARLAAQIMVPQGSGLIVATSGYVGVTYTYGVVFGLCKTAVDRMARDMAIELQPHNVASVSLWQGLTMTERAQRNLNARPEMTKSIVTRPAVGCSPEFPGRVIAALATDSDLMNLSGGTFITAELAQRYGITDVDGKTIPSLRAERGSPIWQPITGAGYGC